MFLSHSHRDKQFVRSLGGFLEAAGIAVWIDEAEIRVGESLTRKLAEAINEVDIVVAIVSSASVSSEWVQKELDLAMNHEIAQRRVKVIPVLKEEVDLPGFLDGKLYADFRVPYKRRGARRALISAIHSLARGRDEA